MAESRRRRDHLPRDRGGRKWRKILAALDPRRLGRPRKKSGPARKDEEEPLGYC